MTELDPIEVQALQALANGKIVKELSQELKQRPWTIKNILIRIKEKTGSRTTTQAVLRAASQGIIHLPKD